MVIEKIPIAGIKLEEGIGKGKAKNNDSKIKVIPEIKRMKIISKRFDILSLIK